MPGPWEGGREETSSVRWQKHPANMDFDPDGDGYDHAYADEVLHPLIEVVAYGASWRAKGTAIYNIVQTYDDGCSAY